MTRTGFKKAIVTIAVVSALMYGIIYFCSYKRAYSERDMTVATIGVQGVTAEYINDFGNLEIVEIKVSDKNQLESLVVGDKITVFYSRNEYFSSYIKEKD